jgi:hypothetical protein
MKEIPASAEALLQLTILKQEQSRRGWLRKVLMGMLGSLLALVGVVTVSCGQNLIKWSGIVVSAFEESMPLIQNLLPGSVATLTKALAVAKDLQAALKNGSANAIDFIEQLIKPDGLFNKLLDDVGALTDPEQRRILSGILLLAGVALRLIAAGLTSGADQLPNGPAIKAKAQNQSGVAVIEKVGASKDLEKLLKASRF